VTRERYSDMMSVNSVHRYREIVNVFSDDIKTHLIEIGFKLKSENAEKRLNCGKFLTNDGNDTLKMIRNAT
jgi:hypothetical protein